MITPWLIRTGITFSFTINGIFGHYSDEVVPAISGKLTYFIIWFVLYLTYLILSGGILFPLVSLQKNKKHQLLYTFIFVLIFSVVLLAANHDTRSKQEDFGRPIGRYVEVVLPFVILAGFLNLEDFRNEYLIRPRNLIFAGLFLAGFSLINFQLFPINNMSLAWLGGIKYVFEYLMYQKVSFDYAYNLGSQIFMAIILISLLIFVVAIRKKLNADKILYIFIASFTLLSLFNYSLIIYNSQSDKWYKSDAIQLGLWFNDYDKGKSKVVFDERDQGHLFGTDPMIYETYDSNISASVIGTFMNNEIRIGDASGDYDYIITKHEMDLNLVKKRGPFLIYKKSDTENI